MPDERCRNDDGRVANCVVAREQPVCLDFPVSGAMGDEDERRSDICRKRNRSARVTLCGRGAAISLGVLRLFVHHQPLAGANVEQRDGLLVRDVEPARDRMERAPPRRRVATGRLGRDAAQNRRARSAASWRGFLDML